MNPEIKDRLEKIRNGIVPEGYKKTKIEIIPDEWESKRIGKLTKIYDGTHQTPTYLDEGIPFYSVEHVAANQFTKTKFISEVVYKKECKRVTIEKQDILMTRIGSVGKVKFINWDAKASFYVSLALLKHNRIDNWKFISFSMQSTFFQKELWKRMIHVAFPIKINLNEISNCMILLPPLPEQTRIATILSTWDKAIELKEKLIEQKKLQKKGLMQLLLTGKKRLINPETGKQFEGEFQREIIGCYLLEILLRNNNQTNKTILSVTNDRGFIKQGEQFERIVASKNTENYKVVRKNQFAYNPARINVGSIALLTNFELGILSPMYVVFKTKEDSLNTMYFYQFIKSDVFKLRLIKFLEGSVRQSLSFSALGRIKLYIPILKEQQIIASVLSKADQEIEFLEKELEQLKEQKRDLMQLLLTGIVRVR